MHDVSNDFVMDGACITSSGTKSKYDLLWHSQQEL